MAIPGIEQSSRTRIYKRIVDQLTTDPALGSRVEWICWDGGRKDVVNLSASRPTIELFPTIGPGEFYSADAQRNDLEISVRLTVPNSYDATDCLDLWAAVEQAIYPFNQREKQQKFRMALGGPDGLGAVTGEILFDRPATIRPIPTEDGKGFSAAFEAVGSFRIAVLRAFNP